MDFSIETLNKYTGDHSQLFYAKQYRFEGGRSDGMRAVDIDNGAGVCFTVLPDRSMDIGRFSYKGINYSHITKAGYVNPQYYDDKGAGGLKTFSGGFLTTCGLTQVGTPCFDNGEELGLHGRISNIAAEYFSVFIENECNIPVIRIQGYMRLAQLFGFNLWLKREICVKVGDSKVFINDEVENRGGEVQPYMVLYHFNIGYPLLDETSKFTTNAEFVKARDEKAEAGVKERDCFEAPKSNYREQVFYYASSKKELPFASLFNPKLNAGVRIITKTQQLKNLIQWKNAGYGDYVMGIEPSNCWVEGRIEQKEYGLEYIDPGEIKTQNIVVEMI